MLSEPVRKRLVQLLGVVLHRMEVLGDIGDTLLYGHWISPFAVVALWWEGGVRLAE